MSQVLRLTLVCSLVADVEWLRDCREERPEGELVDYVREIHHFRVSLPLPVGLTVVVCVLVAHVAVTKCSHM